MACSRTGPKHHERKLALRYAAKQIDIIPDSVPEIGYADDSLFVRTVLSRTVSFCRVGFLELNSESCVKR
jgi:uncharacterized membrane protein YkvA (DUF1232 family)